MGAVDILNSAVTIEQVPGGSGRRRCSRVRVGGPGVELDDEQRLVAKIADQIGRIEAFLRRARPRHARLTAVTIVSAALAAALTAGPALGGKSFTDWARQTFNLTDASQVWRLLCLLAMVVSVTAAICASLNEVSKTESRIASAEACRTELACLQTLIEFRQIAVSEALTLYQQHLTRVPFLDQPESSSSVATFSWDRPEVPRQGDSERRTSEAAEANDHVLEAPSAGSGSGTG